LGPWQRFLSQSFTLLQLLWLNNPKCAITSDEQEASILRLDEDLTRQTRQLAVLLDGKLLGSRNRLKGLKNCAQQQARQKRDRDCLNYLDWSASFCHHKRSPGGEGSTIVSRSPELEPSFLVETVISLKSLVSFA
jgi:hypothetical protein